MRSVALAVAAMLAGVSTPAPAAETYYVAPTGIDNATCGTPGARCKTVQFAIDKTEDGDAVVVANGTYNECVTIIPGTGVGSVSVLSEALVNLQPIGSAILDGADVCDAASGDAGPVVTVYDLSILSGFAVKNGGDSGVLGLGAVAITNNVISDNTTPTAGGGIFLTTGSYLTDPEKKALIKFNSIKENTSEVHGGGVYVDAWADGVASFVEIDGNTIVDNTAGGVSGAAFGGGLTVFTDTASATDVSTVAITTNVLDGNTAANAAGGGAIAYGGGMFVATGGGSGAGTETIVVGGASGANSVRNNTSEGIGGGISANLQPGEGGVHTITVADNNVTANTGQFGGGGIHAFAVAFDLTSGDNALIVERNSMVGNHVVGDPTDPLTVGGGGLYAELYNYRVPDGIVEVTIRRNGMRTNDVTTTGGGAGLRVYADDDPDADGNTLPAIATLDFENNLVAGNTAVDETGGTGAGGGVALLAQSIGAQASVTVRQRFLTVAENLTDPGGAGGLSWDAQSLPDSVSGGGSIAIELSNSILIDNDGYAVGGPIVPGGAITTSISYNDALGNVQGDYEPQLGASTGTNGNVDVDPMLDPLFQPRLCSAPVDLGDPALDPTEEPLPNGGRVNLGFLGNTVNATRTFPDVNADGSIDGIDILGIAVSFNAASGDPRFILAADRDLNGLVDGLDLAYVSAFYAQSCP